MSDVTIPDGLINSLKSASRVVALTGAGISAESNIPTFRDAMSGLWAKYNPQDLATPEAFMRDPKLVWDWYQWRRELCAGAEPNPGHHALVEMEKRNFEFTLVTQNVDGLHQQAGSENVIELHGNITRSKCLVEHTPCTSWPESEDVPKCPNCGALLRPDVVWFGESLPPQALETAVNDSGNCDVFFSIGTSAVVQPAASLVYSAMRNGAVTVEINPMGTPQSGEVDYALKGPSGVILPKIMAALG